MVRAGCVMKRLVLAHFECTVFLIGCAKLNMRGKCVRGWAVARMSVCVLLVLLVCLVAVLSAHPNHTCYVQL